MGCDVTQFILRWTLLTRRSACQAPRKTRRRLAHISSRSHRLSICMPYIRRATNKLCRPPSTNVSISTTRQFLPRHQTLIIPLLRLTEDDTDVDAATATEALLLQPPLWAHTATNRPKAVSNKLHVPPTHRDTLNEAPHCQQPTTVQDKQKKCC